MLVGAIALMLTLAASDEAALQNRLSSQLAAAYDSSEGGFVHSRGVPSESAVELAFALGDQDPVWNARALRTIEWTRTLFDSTGGGWLEAKQDADPSQPMFSKNTLSNARRLENLIQAWRATDDPAFEEDAARAADFFDRVLKDGRGGFIAGQVGDRELVPESNGAAIHAWLEWSAMTRDRRTFEFALLSLDRSWEVCWDPEYGMLRKGVFGEPLKVPQLVDQVEMGIAAVLAAAWGKRPADLERARSIGDHLLARYEDKEKGGFRGQSVPRKNGKFKQAGRDGIENARAARFLCELSWLTGDAKYREAARRTWTAFAPKLDGAELAAADWGLAIRAATRNELTQRPEWIARVEPLPTPRRSFRMRVRR